MLADELDFVVGVDPHRDSHAIAVVEVRSGVVVFEASVTADSGGYAEALRLAEQHAPGRRAFAIEGTGSYGAGLARFLAEHGEQVFEVGRLRRERRSGGKTDALDAVRAARSVLEQKRPATPRSSGEREALRALMAARDGAVNAKRAGLCQLRDLLVTTPEPLRSELRPLSRARLLSRLSATRPHRRQRPRAARNAARPARGRSTRAAADRRGTRAGARDRAAHQQARPAAARPARHRPTARRPDRALLVTPRPPAPARPPSPGSPAPPRSPPRPARRSATDSTAAATDNSTAHSTRSSSPDAEHTDRPSTTSSAESEKARAAARPPAASSATSPATSTDSSSTRHRRLDKHRSIPFTRSRGRSSAPRSPAIVRLCASILRTASRSSARTTMRSCSTTAQPE